MVERYFVFLFFLLQAGLIFSAQREVSRPVRVSSLIKIIQDADTAFSIIKPGHDELTKYFTLLLQDTVQSVVGERVGGDYNEKKQLVLQELNKMSASSKSADKIASDHIRISIAQYVADTYKVKDLVQLNQRNKRS